MKLLGNNSQYTGKIVISDNIKDIYFGCQSFTDVVSNSVDLNYIFIGNNTIKLIRNLNLNSLIVKNENTDGENKKIVTLYDESNKSYYISIKKLKALKNCVFENNAGIVVRQ